MTAYFIDDIIDAVEKWGNVVRVVITRTHGSTPRDAGASMIVASDDFIGTIGGGKLEYLALAEARDMLQKTGGPLRKTQQFVLGTELRQCCGGVAWLLLELFGPDHLVKLREQRNNLKADSFIMRPTDFDGLFFNTAQHMDDMRQWPMIADTLRQYMNGDTAQSLILINDEENTHQWVLEPAAKSTAPLYIYGAGHVGRALVRVMEDTPFEITWVETDESRFPSEVPHGVKTVVAPSQADYAAQVGTNDAFHVVMTYSHEADLEICRAVLLQGQGQYLGLIASETKKAKFINRLKKDGVSAQAFDMFKCPIGLLSFKHKEPSIVAISIAAQLIAELEHGAYELMIGSKGDYHDI